MTVWMNSRRTIGSSPEVGSSSTSSSGSGQIAVISASCVRCPFDRWLVFCADVEPELIEQRALGVAVPARAERREVVERVAHGHPRIERDVVGHVGEPRLDGDFVRAPDPGRRRCTSPLVGRSRFSRHLIVVVLPAPLRPKKP